MADTSGGIMTIYIVSRGEMGEGSSIQKVFTTLEKAQAFAKNMSFCFVGGWESDGPHNWYNGCDYIEIEEWEVL